MAKKRLTEIDFSKQGAHLALCTKEQGTANGVPQVLIMKSLETETPEVQTPETISDTSTQEEVVEKACDDKKSKGTRKTKPKESNMSEETVEKSAELAAILKQFEDQKIELQKAKEESAVYKAHFEAAQAKEKEAAAQGRKLSINECVKNETHAQVLFKNFEAISDDAFVETMAVIKALAASAEMIERSDLFKEVGASGEPVLKAGSTATKSLVEKMVNAKFSNSNK